VAGQQQQHERQAAREPRRGGGRGEAVAAVPPALTRVAAADAVVQRLLNGRQATSLHQVPAQRPRLVVGLREETGKGGRGGVGGILRALMHEGFRHTLVGPRLPN
jgi:hypothetical protein